MFSKYSATISFLCLTLVLPGLGAGEGPAVTDPAKADNDFAFQGEFSGTIKAGGGDLKIGVQVIALGEGKFNSVSYLGGLPGDGWDGGERYRGEGTLSDGSVLLKAEQASAVIKDGKLSITTDSGEELGTLDKIHRSSPTMGKSPPEGAVVLFSGEGDESKWVNGKLSDDGMLMQGVTSKERFGSHQLHIEFRLPYQPNQRGQRRGNSGIYLQGRHEVQMLDSFGLEGKDNECGGLYEVKDPDLNMCFPPLAWQTYDIDFAAAKFDDNGKVASAPRITVRHNGVLIHDDVELPKDRSSRASPLRPGPDPGPVYLQDHGNPVRYRNIWVLPSG